MMDVWAPTKTVTEHVVAVIGTCKRCSGRYGAQQVEYSEALAHQTPTVKMMGRLIVT